MKEDGNKRGVVSRRPELRRNWIRGEGGSAVRRRGETQWMKRRMKIMSESRAVATASRRRIGRSRIGMTAACVHWAFVRRNSE